MQEMQQWKSRKVASNWVWETRKREGDYKVLNLVIKDVMMLFTEI